MHNIKLTITFLWLSLTLLTVQKEKPRVLIIGDSISLRYTPFVKKLLEDEADVFHNPGNAQHTATGIKHLESWIGDGEYDLIQFNWGLWDLCYRHPDSKLYGNRDKKRGQLTHSLEVYSDNLITLVRKLQNLTDAQLLFLSTTYVPPEEAGRFENDVEKYNHVAKSVMKQYNIPVYDIYGESKILHKHYGIGKDDVHFTPEGYQKMAILITENIRNLLKKK